MLLGSVDASIYPWGFASHGEAELGKDRQLAKFGTSKCTILLAYGVFTVRLNVMKFNRMF